MFHLEFIFFHSFFFVARVNGTIRAWAMFDFAKDISCQLNTVL